MEADSETACSSNFHILIHSGDPADHEYVGSSKPKFIHRPNSVDGDPSSELFLRQVWNEEAVDTDVDRQHTWASWCYKLQESVQGSGLETNHSDLLLENESERRSLFLQVFAFQLPCTLAVYPRQSKLKGFDVSVWVLEQGSNAQLI